MTTIHEKVYTVVEIRDSGHEPVIARFSNQEAAYQAKELVDGYGGRVQGELLEFTIYDSFEEYIQAKKSSLKKSALSKLTKEEKLILGL